MLATNPHMQHSTFRLKPDPIPKIRTAGRNIMEGLHVDMSIRQDMYPRILAGNTGTPPSHQKYRRTTNAEPGKIQVHFGLVGQNPDFGMQHSYGKPSYASEHVDQVIKAQNLTGLADKFNDAKEAKYASMVREPLGRTYQRGYEFPAEVHQPKHAFGKPTPYSIPAKECVAPEGGSLEERPDVQRMYQMTHGNYAAGEKKLRNYDWASNPNISEGSGNPLAHPFGYGE